MKIITNVNKGFFLISTMLIGILTVISFFAAWAKDEGTIGDDSIWILFAALFNIFRFPTHNLFWSWMNGGLFFIGLVLNSMFYGFIIERLFHFVITKREKRHANKA